MSDNQESNLRYNLRNNRIYFTWHNRRTILFRGKIDFS